MLNMVKNSFKTIFINTLIIVLIGSFVLWGISGLTLGAANTALTVGDVKISAGTFEKEYRNQVNALQGKYGRLSKEQLVNFRVADNTIALLMRKALLDGGAEDLDLYVSKKQLKDNITSVPSFKDENGHFSMAIYRNVLSRNNFTVDGFENTQRGNIMRTMLQDFFIGNYLDANTTKRLLTAEKEVMGIELVTITDKNIGNIKTATMLEIEVYHNENADAFTTDETRDFKVLSLRTAELEKQISFSAADAQTLYDTDPDAYTIPEKREIEHILLFDEKEATTVHALVAGGSSSFKTLAQQKSKDPVSANKSGNIGAFTYEELVETFGSVFSDKVFGLQVQTLADVVQSDFGYHVVRISKIAPEQTLSFAEAKTDLMSGEKKRLAEDLYFELFDKVEDDISSGLTLTEIAAEYKLPLSAYTHIKPTGSDMPYAAKITPAAFSIEMQGEIGSAVELDNESGALYVELNKITPIRNLTVSEASEAIKKSIKDNKTLAAMREKANSILESVKNGSSLKSAATAAKVASSFKAYKNIGRKKENAPEWMNNSLISALFNNQQGAVLEQVVTTGDGFAVISLKSRHNGSYDTDEEVLFKRVVANAMNDDLYQQYVNSLYEETTVDYNDALIQRVVDVVSN